MKVKTKGIQLGLKIGIQNPGDREDRNRGSNLFHIKMPKFIRLLCVHIRPFAAIFWISARFP